MITDGNPDKRRARGHYQHDGSVTFSNLPEGGPPAELVELIYSLNPDAVIACDALPKPTKARRTHDREDRHVAKIMGNQSDWPTMKHAADVLESRGRV